MAKPLGYQQITSLGTAVALTVPDHASKAVIMCTGPGVRYRDDGASPTASAGMFIPANTIIEFTSGLADLKFIEISGSAILNISYYGSYS